MNEAATIGAKLQALVDGNCIKSHAAEALTPEQKIAIENLNMSQIDALIEVRAAVGVVTTAEFI